MIQGIRFHTETGYLTVEVDGQWDLRDAEHVIESIRDEARNRGQTRIFLDLHNFLPPESIMTRYFQRSSNCLLSRRIICLFLIVSIV